MRENYILPSKVTETVTDLLHTVRDVLETVSQRYEKNVSVENPQGFHR